MARLDPENVPSLDAEFRLLTDIVARVAVAKLRFRHDWGDLDRVLDIICAA